MLRLRPLRLAIPLILFSMAAPAAPSGPSSPPVPATAATLVPTRAETLVETIHGVKIPDPYRWLENDSAAEVSAWTDAQNALTRGVLGQVPGRVALEARLWALHEIGSLGAPVPRPLGAGRVKGWRYFYERRDGKQNQAVLYVREGLGGVAPRAGGDRALIDVNSLATDGTSALDWWYPSEDARLVAYGISQDGSEESVLRVRDVVTGADLPDTIARTRACSLAWLNDSSGFYYTRYPVPGSVPAGEERYHRRVFFHRLGTPSEEDAPIFGVGRDLKDWPSVVLSPDDRFLAIEVSQGWSKSEIFLLDRRTAGSASGAVTAIAVDEAAIFDLAEITTQALFIRTNAGAPRYRLMRVPLPSRAARPARPLGAAGAPPSPPGAPSAHHLRQPPAQNEIVPGPPRSDWREVIAEGAQVLQQVALVGKTLAALFLGDAVSHVRLFGLDGRIKAELDLPSLGTVGGIMGHPRGQELFLPFTSFTSPTSILRQALTNLAGASRGTRDRSLSVPSQPRGAKADPTSPPGSATPPPTVVGSASPQAPRLAPSVWLRLASPVASEAFMVTQDRFTSKDGTTIPLFIVHRRDVVRTPATPTVLYGYGGFNVNITPAWAPSIMPFLENGGVYAAAVLRGGGEYGEDWHRAGMLERKQNVFDDFTAAAQHLIATKVTSPERLAIMGRSNGGLLVGAALTQRPDLFRAAVCGVPLLDMLRYHRFRIAKLWIPEYGSSDDATAFAWLRRYSPYHNVKAGTAYPAVLFTTAASDTRVDPLHARKMTAALQAATISERPVLLRLETQAGHGAGKPLGKVIAQLVDEWAFLSAELGMGLAPR